MKMINALIDCALFSFALLLALIAVAPACIASVLLFSAAILSGVTKEKSAR